ncbi:hypothetical protein YASMINEVIRUS_265 [Yasminevirus sp. GU-2018]|uniref:RING-type domain-containing protein n=1 Tax=Yasminevirus sp. GU-2018 TaxID=2420051 RepID=A0A5K0U8R9_9VIRU|nr:hypothetical protein YASMINEVIRUS_265 [Yasminevirus sp. GU-2018]
MSAKKDRHTTKESPSKEASVEAEQPQKQQVKITLAGLPRVVATWEYTAENDECSLCHRDLMSPVAVVDHGKTTYVNGVVIGTCQHGFHDPCITSWIKNGNMSCPKCKTPWKTSKNVGSSVYVYKSTA